jgi:outer membrane protein assembly factor BamB
MAPKNTFPFNITPSVKILILSFLIFVRIDAQTQIRGEQRPFLLSNPLVRCSPVLTGQPTNILSASDNSLIIYASYPDGLFEALDMKTKSKIWRTELGSKISSKSILEKSDNKTLFIMTESNSTVIWAINAETGIAKWRVSVASVAGGESFLYLFQNALIVVCKNGTILSIDKSTGSVNWSKSINLPFTSDPSFIKDSVFLSTSGQTIVIALSDGTIRSQFNTSTAIYNLLALNKKEFIWTDKTGRLFNGDKLKFRAGAEIAYLNLTSDGILIASNDNFLYFASKTDQKILWKKKLAGRVFPKPLIVDNFAVVAVSGESELLIFDLKSGRIVNSMAIENGDFFAEDFFIASGKLFTPTNKGLFAFASTVNDCF